IEVLAQLGEDPIVAMRRDDQRGFCDTLASQNGKIVSREKAHERGRFDWNLIRPKPVTDGIAVAVFRYKAAIANHIRHRLCMSKPCDATEIISAPAFSFNQRRRSITA